MLLANTAHSTTLSYNRKQVWHAVTAFLSDPADATRPFDASGRYFLSRLRIVATESSMSLRNTLRSTSSSLLM